MLICDKRRPASREQPDTSPPEGGDCPPFAHPSVGCALRLRRPARRLGRLHGGGACRPPAPLGCAPWRAHAHRAPAACRPVGRGKRSAQGRRPGGFPGFGGNFKKAPQGREAGRGLGGRAPPGSGAVGNRVEPVGGQGATRSVVPAVHGRPRLSTAERAMGNSGLNNLIGQTFFKLLPKPLRTRSSIEFQKNYCIKKHVIQLAQRCAG